MWPCCSLMRLSIFSLFFPTFSWWSIINDAFSWWSVANEVPAVFSCVVPSFLFSLFLPTFSWWSIVNQVSAEIATKIANLSFGDFSFKIVKIWIAKFRTSYVRKICWFVFRSKRCVVSWLDSKSAKECKFDRSPRELSNEYLLFTFKNWFRYSRERVPESLPKGR